MSEAKPTPGSRSIHYRGDLGEWHVVTEDGETIGVFYSREDAVLDVAAPDLRDALAAIAEGNIDGEHKSRMDEALMNGREEECKSIFWSWAQEKARDTLKAAGVER